MIGLIVFVSSFAVLFLLAAIFDVPRRLWWRFKAPTLDNPEAHEPSDSYFRWGRIGLVVVAGILVWQVVTVATLPGAFD
ncbi:hypothetical protein AB0A69_31405 [Streptomyces sp. NPDC045431]|uniref:hypothetical protein n=1 Tax=Streptomyces sp. NPDC045431 TaxID=3155613 RepID=UPI0033E05332